MFCNKCGNEIHDDAVICVHCGCAIAGRSVGNKKKAGVNVINIVQLILALICGVLMFLPDAFGRRLYELGLTSGTKSVSILEAIDSYSDLDDIGLMLIIAICAYFIYRIIALCVRSGNATPLKVGSLIASSVMLLFTVIFVCVADGHVYETVSYKTYSYGYYSSDTYTIPAEYHYDVELITIFLLALLAVMIILDIVNLVKSKKIH